MDSGSLTSGSLIAAMLSHPGRVRRGNEDACAMATDRGAFVVCDGVGGAAAGEIASRLAADTLLDSLAHSASDGLPGGERLARAASLANERVYRRARENRAQRGMGTTLVSLLAEPNPASAAAPPRTPPRSHAHSWGHIWLANIGDSRCYRLRRGLFEQLTHDHSVVEEQVRSGEMTREQADASPIRNVITRAIGSLPQVEADIASLPADLGDLYLLTTDGLPRELTDLEIAEILAQPPEPGCPVLTWLVDTCEALIDAAIERGGGDNITCLLVQLC